MHFNPLYYANLLTQRSRLAAFRRGIRAMSRGKVVADIGCGIGTYVAFALEGGARSVVAVEMAPIIGYARECIGDDAAVRYLEGDVCKIQSSEKWDVAIFEDFAPNFYDHDTVRIIRHVGEHLLDRRGVFFPNQITLMAAPVCYPAFVNERTSLARYRNRWINFDPLNPYLSNHWRSVKIPPRLLLAPPTCLQSINLARDKAFRLDRVVKFSITKPGELHGILLWMEFMISSNQILSNAPGKEASWGQAFFPFDTPLKVLRDDRIRFSIRAIPDATGQYWWEWIIDRHNLRHISMKQSTVQGYAWSHRESNCKGTTF